MKTGFLAAVVLILSCAILTAAGPQSEASPAADDKPALVESGYISKIDLKKKILTVQGYVVAVPGDKPQEKSEKFIESFQTPRGGRGGGRGSSGRGSNGAGGGAPAEPIREFSVYVRPDTAIQDDKSSLTIDDLKIEDYVLVLGTPRGKSINVNATSISVSNR